MRYRDVSEYATLRILTEVMPALRKQGITPTVGLMRQFRDGWVRDGQAMDFATMKARPSDVERLLRSTGATSFGLLDKSPTLKDGIVEMWTAARNEYEAEAEAGRFLHTITDPIIREHVLDNASVPVNKAFYYADRSIRSLNPGESIALHDRKTNEAFATVDVQDGFAMAPLPEQTSRKQTAPASSGGFATAPLSEQPSRKQTAPKPATPPAKQAAPIEKGNLTKHGFFGWSGGVALDGGEYKGLKDAIGMYLSKSDMAILSKKMDERRFFDGELVQNTVELLQHMRSNGYVFEIRDDDKRNRIEARMEAGNNLNIRLFDEEQNGKYIGHTYDTYNMYYYNQTSRNRSAKEAKYSSADSIAILDYVTGHKDGRVVKAAGRNTSKVYLNAGTSDRALHVVPSENRYDTTRFVDADEANAYIEESIASARESVNDQFRLEAIQAAIDATLDDPEALLTGPEFQATLDGLYSPDIFVRAGQEELVKQAIHSRDGGEAIGQAIRDGVVGTYEEGFNPVVVIEHMEPSGRGIEREAMAAALKVAKYDTSLIQGNDFAVNMLRERLVAFDPETAKSRKDVDHPQLRAALQLVETTLTKGQVKKVEAMIDDNGIIRWEGDRMTGSSKPDKKFQRISGEIGQVLVQNEKGVIETKFNHDANYGIVPGYTGYFAFEGDYENRMERFRAKGLDQHLSEKIKATLVHQMTRPYDEELQNIPTTLDASAVNGIYHGDVYGKRIDLDFFETSQLNDVTKDAIIKTLASRVRFDNQFSDNATTQAETQAKRDKEANRDTEDYFSYLKVAGGSNMRVIGKDAENYVDMTMTGTNKTQGLVWYLTDGAKVNPDGSVTPSKGYEKDGVTVPDTTALQKLDYFENKKFSAWDRNQMSSNQLLTALKVDEKVNTALISFGGWTFDDSYAVSKDFADRNKVFGADPNEHSMDVLEAALEQLRDGATVDDVKASVAKEGMIWSEQTLRDGVEQLTNGTDDTYTDFLEEHGRFRPLQRGDKLSDFGGNKGTIGIVIDRDMAPDEAKALKLDKEVRFMKANPKLDVISAPYSMLSRHNAGVVKELMSGEVNDLVDPDTGEVFKAAMGQLNIIVTDMKVDKKTRAYTKEDVAAGQGRKASGQYAWAVQSKNAVGMMNEIYGHNESAWSTYREYLIATGLDMKPDGTIVNGYTPHDGEERHVFTHEPDVDSAAFLNQIQDKGGFLKTPFPLKFKNEQETTEVPILSASLRQNVEVIDGTMRRSDFTNHYANLYDAITSYHESVAMQKDLEQLVKDAETEDALEKAEKDLTESKETEEASKRRAQDQFDKIQSTIIDRQFNGGHNGKHSFIRDKIMGKRMENSATGVAIVDPRLNIGEMSMNSKMMSALSVQEGATIAGHRDPAWRDGAIRSFTVVCDETVHGVALNPITDKSHDMDFDGDTMGLMHFTTKEAVKDLKTKFSHAANMIDHGSGKNELYFQSGMDLASAAAKAKEAGDNRPEELYAKAVENAGSSDPRRQKLACKALNDYSHVLFREHGFGGDYVSLESDATVEASFAKMVQNKAKGSPEKLADYMKYHNGEKTEADARAIQYATGVKSDDTGLAGAFSQKLVSAMRNTDITGALESMYPLTQGTLQIKHDAEHAVVVNDILTKDINQVFRGRSMKDGSKKLTPRGFKNELTEIMEKRMKVDVNEKFIDAVTDTVTVGGKVVPLKEAMAIKGSPMDRVAYGGGYKELLYLAENKESLLTGEQNRLFAPFSMRDANEKTRIAKKDTQVKKPTPAPVTETVVEREAEDEGISV